MFVKNVLRELRKNRRLLRGTCTSCLSKIENYTGGDDLTHAYKYTTQREKIYTINKLQQTITKHLLQKYDGHGDLQTSTTCNFLYYALILLLTAYFARSFPLSIPMLLSENLGFAYSRNAGLPAPSTCRAVVFAETVAAMGLVIWL